MNCSFVNEYILYKTNCIRVTLDEVRECRITQPSNDSISTQCHRNYQAVARKRGIESRMIIATSVQVPLCVMFSSHIIKQMSLCSMCYLNRIVIISSNDRRHGISTISCYPVIISTCIVFSALALKCNKVPEEIIRLLVLVYVTFTYLLQWIPYHVHVQHHWIIAPPWVPFTALISYSFGIRAWIRQNNGI